MRLVQISCVHDLLPRRLKVRRLGWEAVGAFQPQLVTTCLTSLRLAGLSGGRTSAAHVVGQGGPPEFAISIPRAKIMIAAQKPAKTYTIFPENPHTTSTACLSQAPAACNKCSVVHAQNLHLGEEVSPSQKMTVVPALNHSS